MAASTAAAGAAITAAKGGPADRRADVPVSVSWSAASRLVRLDTGSSRLAVFASQTTSTANGAAGRPRRGGKDEHHRGEQHRGGIQAEHHGGRGRQRGDEQEQRPSFAASTYFTRCPAIAAAAPRPMSRCDLPVSESPIEPVARMVWSPTPTPHVGSLRVEQPQKLCHH